MDVLYYFFNLTWTVYKCITGILYVIMSIIVHDLALMTYCTNKIDWLIFGVITHFQQYFSYIMATSFSGGRSRSTRREPPTMDKQLVIFITCGCESSDPFL